MSLARNLVRKVKAWPGARSSNAAPIRGTNSFETSALTFVSDGVNERPDEPRAPEEVL